MHRASRLMASIVLFGVPQAAPVAAQTPVQVAAFNSIEVRNSTHAVLRPGPAHRVTLLKGSLDYTRIAVTNGVLVIDKCRVKCPRGYELEVEIVAPSVSRISLAHGGWLESVGTFARQADLSAAVAHGGRIDVRAIPVDRVTATVEQGGRILTVPRSSLLARVNQGGVITYWGDAEVKSSVQHGGDVHLGEAHERNLPLSELDGAIMSTRHKRQRH